MNPFLDKGGAAVGAVIMSAALITLLVLNAVDQKEGEHPVYFVTLPAAFIMFAGILGSDGTIDRRRARSRARVDRKLKRLEPKGQLERRTRGERLSRRRTLPKPNHTTKLALL